MKRPTITVDIPVDIPNQLYNLSKTFIQALSHIDTLYDLQKKKDLSIREEKRIWNQIPEQISSEEVRDSDIRKLIGGIYDLYPITIDHNGNEIDFVVGKVFTSEGDATSYYSGVAGVVNNNFKDVLEKFDSKLEKLCGQLSADYYIDNVSIKEQAPDIRCLDVFSLAGAFDLSHKPISIFFAGNNPENISTLSNMTVFISLYAARFRALTANIAKRHLLDSELLEELSDAQVSELLLIWLRGHDVGHFIGEDKLGNVMSQFDTDYMILHELKSDIIALYSFRLHAGDLLADGMLKKIYFVAVAEMLRYIRRGDILKYPDSASAYLAWCYFEQSGAIVYDSGSKEYGIDYKKLEDSVSKFTYELLGIFKEGNIRAARDMVKRYGSLESINEENPFPRDCASNLREVLCDTNIAYYIDYNFRTK